MSRSVRGRWTRAVAVTATVGAVAVVPGVAFQHAAAAELTAPVFVVTSEGLTADKAKVLADRAGIPNALRADGSFAYQSENFAKPPLVTVGQGRGEDGPTVSQALDRQALDAITVLTPREAQAKAAELLPIASPYKAKVTVGHTAVEQTDARGAKVVTRNLDTTVSYQLTLAGRPVIGPGAKLGISFAGDGSVMKLNQTVRGLKAGGEVAIIAVDEAEQRCSELYPGVDQGTPTLAYYAPPLAATRASGRGAATTIAPHYVCQPTDTARDPVSALTGRLVPAAPDLEPGIIAVADFDGKTMTARADVTGGTGPYSYAWSSSTTALGSSVSVRPTLSYVPRSRERGVVETLTLTVTDANGISETLSLTPSAEPGQPGHAEASGQPGGSGGAFYEAGIEQTVDEWACAQASAQGFRDVMTAKSQTVNFDFRGAGAWEKDFRDPSRSGNDTNYADAVDIQWYTGHGGPGGFTFKNSTHDDGSIVPADARWGNTDLEWLNLESCQVLKDTSGSFDFFSRWGPTMTGLHLLNGFDTNATCVNGGTGRTFASYLFPQNFLFWHLPALTVSQAWGTTANALEPSGTKWRSMSLVGSGGVNNLGDYFWGQGGTGPDLTYAGRTGMIAVSGVV